MPTAYLVRNGPWRLSPLMGGPDVPIGVPVTPPSWPPNYGTPGVTYIPDSLTTGPLQGSTLTRVNGTNGVLSISTPGTPGVPTYVKKEFYCRVSIAAADVSFQECVFHGDPAGSGSGALVTASNVNAKRAIIWDSIFDPVGVPRPNGIIGHDVKVYRSEFRNCIDYYDPSNSNQVSALSGAGLYGCWLHDFAYFSPDPGHADNQTHNDGVQVIGVTGFEMIGNYLQGYYGGYGTHQPGNLDNPMPSGHANADLTAMLTNYTASTGVPGGNIIEDNWIEGFYATFNFGGGGAGTDLGRAWRNHFKGDHGVPTTGAFAGVPYTFWRRPDQTLDVGTGANINTFYDGSPIVVHTNG